MNEREALARQVHGRDSHVHSVHALEGLEALDAGKRPASAPHSIFQLVRHLIYWQDLGLARIRGGRPPRPATAAEGWTATVEPEGADQWNDAVEEFTAGLWDLQALLDDPDTDLDLVSNPEPRRVARQEVLMVLCHNSYHLGQIVLLRQQLGRWPPPQGGDTW